MLDKTNVITIIVTLLSIPIMIIWYFFAYENIELVGYVNREIQNFTLIGGVSSFLIIAVYLKLLLLIIKKEKNSADLHFIKAYEYLKVHVFLTLTAFPLIVLYLFLFSPGVSTSAFLYLYGLKLYVFPIITAYANVVTFASMIYLLLFIRCFLYHSCNRDTLTRTLTAFYIFYLPLIMSPDNFYALKSTEFSSIRGLIIATNFLLTLFMAVYAVKRLIALIKHIDNEDLLIRLKLLVMSFLFFMFSFLPQILWLFHIYSINIFIWNILSLNILAIAAFLLYLGLR